MTIDTNIPSKKAAISLYGSEKFGLLNVTIIGGWLNEDGQNYLEYDNWGHTELLEFKEFRTINMEGVFNSFVDNVRLINNASHSIGLYGYNNAIRDVEMDRTFCKGENAQGYFFISGLSQLITNCRASRLRHVLF